MSDANAAAIDGDGRYVAKSPGEPQTAEVAVFEARAVPTTCIETIGGDPDTAMRLSFQIKVF